MAADSIRNSQAIMESKAVAHSVHSSSGLVDRMQSEARRARIGDQVSAQLRANGTAMEPGKGAKVDAFA